MSDTRGMGRLVGEKVSEVEIKKKVSKVCGGGCWARSARLGLLGSGSAGPTRCVWLVRLGWLAS